MDRIHVMQLVRSYQVGEINRRTFLDSRLGRDLAV